MASVRLVRPRPRVLPQRARKAEEAGESCRRSGTRPKPGQYGGGSSGGRTSNEKNMAPGFVTRRA